MDRGSFSLLILLPRRFAAWFIELEICCEEDRQKPLTPRSSGVGTRAYARCLRNGHRRRQSHPSLPVELTSAGTGSLRCRHSRSERRYAAIRRAHLPHAAHSHRALRRCANIPGLACRYLSLRPASEHRVGRRNGRSCTQCRGRTCRSRPADARSSPRDQLA